MTIRWENGKLRAVRALDNEKTGAVLKEARKEKELTRKELAETLYITDRVISKWERGLRYPWSRRRGSAGSWNCPRRECEARSRNKKGTGRGPVPFCVCLQVEYSFLDLLGPAQLGSIYLPLNERSEFSGS